MDLESKDFKMDEQIDNVATLYELQQRGEITTAHFSTSMLSKLRFKPAPANAFLYLGSIVRRVEVVVQIMEELQAFDRYEFSWQTRARDDSHQDCVLIRFESDSILTRTPESRLKFKVGSWFRFIALPTLEPEFHLLVLSTNQVSTQQFLEYHRVSCLLDHKRLSTLGQEFAKQKIDPSVKQLIRPGTETKTLQRVTDDILTDLLNDQDKKLARYFQEDENIKSSLPVFGDISRKELFKMTKESRAYKLKQDKSKKPKKKAELPVSDSVWMVELLSDNI